ncbi:MAG TPA: DUF305 domain-containing protein, partial [Marmoricola sp.]|nr:DUF305 domain-containing protein [Marmoricola sp.]
AYDIITSQQQQAGQMYGWLTQWGLPQTSPNGPMAWMSSDQERPPGPSASTMPGMDHGSSGDAAMPGMAAADDLQRLQSSTGRDAERIFLQLMIAHHHGGVSMAQAVLERTQRTEVRTLATAIVTAQSAEITQMQQLLDKTSS